ncbi:sulfate transporter family-domain-containing protein [Naematelia encephala]|uniref:Sulfate transporter family-domain-containing protein n=1 Tax=Naematelia encephala TaxID=71784 RepID=A0A1Y2BEV1_9TREE|nr:sulfate transporter family-domain-containing protein [Naematelia encephala]
MPARDPAASPHHWTNMSPTNSQHQTSGVFSPSSSSFSIREDEQGPSGTSPPRDGLISQVFARRVSQTPLAEDGGQSRHGSGSGWNGREELSEDRSIYPTSLSTSSQAIRDSSNRLASLSFKSSRQRRTSSGSGSPNDIFQQSSVSPQASKSIDHKPVNPSHLNKSVKADTSPQVLPGSFGTGARSGLSMMMDRERAAQKASYSQEDIAKGLSPVTEDEGDGKGISVSEGSTGSGGATPVPKRSSLVEVQVEVGGDPHDSSDLRLYLASELERHDIERASESTPLLPGGGPRRPLASKWRDDVYAWKKRVEKVTLRDVVRNTIEEPVKTLPSVVLGLLLNVLDGVSYGMILFPANPVFQDFGSLGVSMFFMSCIVSQLVFSLGGSIFPGGNGSMMIEAVPFFHILVNIIQTEIGDDDRAIIATTMVSFAFSSILTGLVFFALGAFKLGSLIGYFPRHILVGCIGGVGIFLIETGLEVSLGLKEEGFEYNFNTLHMFFQSSHSILLWTIPLGLAILLRVITHFYHHQLVFPAYFFFIPAIFYIVVAIGHWDFQTLRDSGWVFDVGKNTQAWWKFYTNFDFSKTNWGAFWAAMPTQLALVFFGILHVPLNVPALGVSLSEDNVKLDRELVAHGFSNFAAGLAGTVPNYLTYVNTVLFYRVGGGSRLSGLMLTAATAAVMFVGPTVISYLPVMVVGALIFVLGIDLVVEAVWDTRRRVNLSEYITIWAIAVGMTLWDFVIGLLFGIVLACIFFVVQSSRRRAIRSIFDGSTAKSTVRRPRSQRAFIQQVGSQTCVMKLQGFLFFGTINTVEDEIRKLLEVALWQHNPIRFLIIDLALVHGLDFSSAEAFVRVQRLLKAKDVLLILCGAAPEGLVGTALRSVDLWSDPERGVEVFAGLNEALEWTENAYLTAFYESQTQKAESDTTGGIDFPKVAKPPFSLAESFQNSPRRTHLARAGDSTLPYSYVPPDNESPSKPTFDQPLPLLMQTFGAYATPDDIDFFRKLVPYFKQVIVSANEVLWYQKDPADGLYLIESGSLRATYAYDDHRELVQETMVAGTIAGDLSTLSETERNATVVAERECVLWKLDKDGLAKLEKESADAAWRFIKIVLKVVAEEQDVLSSHLIAVLS